MFSKEIEKAYKDAIKVLESCSTPNGFYAAYPGYDMVFARDAMIMSLGASLVNTKFKKVFKDSLMVLANYQSENGQIPNAVDIFSKRKPHIDYQSIDSTLWFIIGNYIYKQRYNDSVLLKKQKKNIEKALNWLACQDPKENSMLAQLPTSDWQDAFPHRYGFTIHSQVLYYKVLQLVGNLKKAEKLKNTVNKDSDTKLWNYNYYLPWRWKNHNKYHEKGEWFDTLGNVLATIVCIADSKQSEKILNYIRKNKIDQPYPMKASVWPPITPDSKDWQEYFSDCDARTTYHYLNSGIWTYAGGFYVCSLVQHKKFKLAEEKLQKLAEGNLVQNFCEWLDGETGKPSQGENQGWNASLFIAAYHSVKEKKNVIF